MLHPVIVAAKIGRIHQEIRMTERLLWSGVVLAWLGVVFIQAQAPQPDGAGVERGVLPRSWPTGGPKCMEQPEWRLHEYNEDFYIIRESGCVHYEKPFLYLIFGKDKVMLMDTGAGTTELAAFVDSAIARWLQRKKRSDIKFMVMHSHGHRDPIAGHSQFKGRAGVEFIAADIPEVQKAFNIKTWPEGIGSLHPAGRLLQLFPLSRPHPPPLPPYHP